MTNVNPVDGVEYGLRLMGHLLAVFVVGGLVAALGVSAGDEIGALLVLVGFLIVFAGVLGIQFKIIADAVERGIRAANDDELPGIGGTLREMMGSDDAGGQRGAPAGQPNQQPQQQSHQQGQRQQQQGQQGQPQSGE